MSSNPIIIASANSASKSEFVRHDPSGLFYMACSTPEARSHWTPALSRLNGTGVPTSSDYFAIFDPSSPSSPARKLRIKNFYDPRGIYVHGLDVVPSSTNPKELFVYAVNHRPPPPPLDSGKVGADSVIELFKTTVGGDTLEHLHTIKHSLIVTPNDIVGSPDGTSFWVTNDHGEKVGFSRIVETYIGKKSSSVVFCDVNDKKHPGGCKIAAGGLRSCNGIAKDPREGDKRFYVVDSLHGEVTILEKQRDNRLVVTDNFKVGRCLDNVSVDKDGTLYVACKFSFFLLRRFVVLTGFIAWPRGIDLPNHIQNPANPISASVHKVTINTDKSSFFGEKYKVEKVSNPSSSPSNKKASPLRSLDIRR